MKRSRYRHPPAAALSRKYWRGTQSPLCTPATRSSGLLEQDRFLEFCESRSFSNHHKEAKEGGNRKRSYLRQRRQGPSSCQTSLLEFLPLSFRSVAHRLLCVLCVTSALRVFPCSQLSPGNGAAGRGRGVSHGRAHSRLLPLLDVRASKCTCVPRREGRHSLPQAY